MLVSVKVSLKEVTATKRKQLRALLRRLRSCTGRYIQSLWDTPGKLDAETLRRVEYPQLGYRQRACCLRLALGTVVATRKSAKQLGCRATCPAAPRRFCLSALLCRVEPGRGSFDYVLRVAGLVPGNRLVLPFKSHAVLNKWLAVPGAEIVQGATVTEEEAILWVRVPDLEEKTSGTVLAVDAGLCKLLVDSEQSQYGTDCRDVIGKVRRCKPGSKGKKRAIAERTAYFNRVVKTLPFDRVSAIAHEDLAGIKTGKRKNRGKSFRKLIAPWTIRQVFSRIDFVARLNRVRVVAVDPRDTSRTCPACRHVASENRKGESFQCASCGHRQDADEVGALNILNKALETLGSVWSPSNKSCRYHGPGVDQETQLGIPKLEHG